MTQPTQPTPRGPFTIDEMEAVYNKIPADRRQAFVAVLDGSAAGVMVEGFMNDDTVSQTFKKFQGARDAKPNPFIKGKK